jgi:hypothetical protein
VKAKDDLQFKDCEVNFTRDLPKVLHEKRMSDQVYSG